MKISRLVLPALFALILVAAPAAYAESYPGGGGYYDGHMVIENVKSHKGGKGGMMAAHHESIREMMEMVRETMAIVRDLSHKPTATDKKKLGEMIDRMDEIIAMEKKGMHGNPCGMNPCGGNPCGGNPCGKGGRY